MKVKSKITGKIYEPELARFIPNMKQNQRYLFSGKAYDSLLDIICGNEDKLVFVWEINEVMDELYDSWCKREL
ncbi:MAG: hypothetical protein RSF40_08940 [Oscillospiraceae bacterium]